MQRSFTFRLPDTWTDYHLATEDFVQRRAELRAQASTDEERDRVDGVVRIAREFVIRARRQGAVSAGGLVELTDDGLVMAFAMAAGLEVPEGTEASLQSLARDLSQPAQTDDGLGALTVTSVVLPNAGAAVRVAGTQIVEITPEVSAAVLTMTTLIPVPGRARSFVVLSAASPNLPLAELLMPLFAQIADSFAFTEESLTV